jgi:hypothetical protein
MNELIAMEQQLNVVTDRVVKLEVDTKKSQERIEELRVVIGGDLTGKPGVLQNQVRMINALFDEKEGLVPRLTSMERRELERMGWIKGAYFAWGVLGVVLGFLIQKYIIK